MGNLTTKVLWVAQLQKTKRT